MTTDPLSRLEAYGDRPDVYDAPTPEECLAAAKEIRRLRKRVGKWEALSNKLADEVESMSLSFKIILANMEALTRGQE